jgi:hypothetical protein
MGKYEPLGQFLKQQKQTRIKMSFAEIERVIGTKLPNSKSSRAFWSNNPDNNVMTKVWVDAGFETGDVDTTDGAVVFKKKMSKPAKSNRHSEKPFKSIFGCLKGTFTFVPGFEPTLPAYSKEEWIEIEQDWLKNWDELMQR